MALQAFLILLARVSLSAAASALQKRLTLGGMRGAVIWRITFAWLALPALLAILLNAPHARSADFWKNAALAGLLDAAGNLAMIAALSATDLSVFGPLNGFRPVLAMAFAWVLLGERLSWKGALGVGVIVAGGLLLMGDRHVHRVRRSAGVWAAFGLRLMGLSISTLASVFFKRALEAGPNGATLGVWILSGLPVVWMGFSKTPQPREPTRVVKHASWLLLIHAAIFFTMQWFTFEIFRTTLLAYSFAFFQFAMVIQVLIGCLLFKETRLAWRLTCCGIMGLGGLIITL